MQLIFPGDHGYDQLDRTELDACWMPVPGRSENEPGRFDLLVVGQVERFSDGDGPDDRVPTYGSAFGRRVGGAMVSDAVAEERVAFRAAVLLADYFARRRLGWFGRRLMSMLFSKMTGRKP